MTLSSESNTAYYAKPVEPHEIVSGAVKNPHVFELCQAAARLIK